MDSEAGISAYADTSEKSPLVYKVLVVITMVSIMGGSLTGLMTYINAGYSPGFFNDWGRSFLGALMVMPAGFLLMGLITRWVGKRMPDSPETTRNLVTGGIMACVMESAMAFATAVNTIGLSDYSQFLAGWLEGFLGALPLGLALMVTVSLTIKPKIEKFLKS